MKFKITTIPPEGRNEYGNYYSSDRIAKNVMRVTYNGNTSTGGNQKKDPVVEPQDNVILFLGKTTLKYNGQDVAVSAQTQTIDVMGYINSKASDTYVGDLTNSAATKYGIIGIPESGMSITVTNNGTPNTKINITINEKVSQRNGTLIIPCSINKKPDDTPLGNDWEDWKLNEKDNMTLMLECQWEVSAVYENSYALELSNEIAGINCDKDGNILAGATRPTCQAQLYLGQGIVTGATYGFTTPTDKNATGVSIDTTTGILTFGSNFKFDGTTLEVKITASVKGTTVYKIMSIVKQYPGVDGTPAITRWVVPSVDTIKLNPNTTPATLTPNTISCKVMKQEGEAAPVEDTKTTLYYDYNTDNPTKVYSSAITIDASKDYIIFGLKNDKGVVYESETVLIVKDGKNGSSGSTGESVYKLTLTNENASINADADGNIFANAHRPTCTATLYYGTTKVPNATYSITTNPTATGVTINSTTGVFTFGSNFNFTGTSLEITVTAKSNGVVYGTNIMTVSKSMQGDVGPQGGVGPAGVSIIWKGSSISAPANPQNGWAYYNTAQKKSYVYQDGAWYQMAMDGQNGSSIEWKGELETPPANPKENWCYKDISSGDGKIYIYDGIAWEVMTQDGKDGDDGLSVYITYNDNDVTNKPNNPTGDGTTNGWHTNSTAAANWMSQKVAASVSEGTWGDPIQICGERGPQGDTGGKGDDAISYWLDLSTTEIAVTWNEDYTAGIANPSVVTIKAYKQIGGNSPTEITTASNTKIKWGYNTTSPQSTGTTINTISTAQTYIMVHLLVDNVIYDRQTITILKDGKMGEIGPQGRTGAAIRGPIDWKNVTTSRLWCDGKGAANTENGEFIDVVVFNGTYYKCTKSYEGKGSETTAPSSTYWTATDNQYEFIATNLLLADNAKINFQTSNELYLMDNDGNVTAGAAGGNGISFWAGANEPGNGKFKVNYDGTMTATKGKFGVLEIGADAWSDGLLMGTHTQNDGTINTLELQPQMFAMEATDNGKIKSRVRIGPYADPDKYDMEGEIFVELDNEKDTAIATNAYISAEGYFTRAGFAASAPMNGLKITFVTDTNYFTKSGDYWLWNGMEMSPYIRTSSYPYVKLLSGEWCFCTSSTSTTGIGTGIYGTAHAKTNKQIYIVI